MTRTQLIKDVARKGYFEVSDVRDVLDIVEETVVETLAKGEQVMLFGGFKLVPHYFETYEGHDPRNGAVIEIPAHYKCKLSTTKKFTEKINDTNYKI